MIFALVFMLSLLDAALTDTLLRTHGAALEWNPYMRTLWTWDPCAFWLTKIASGWLAGLMFEAFSHKRLARAGAAVCAGLLAGACGLTIYLLAL